MFPGRPMECRPHSFVHFHGEKIWEIMEDSGIFMWKWWCPQFFFRVRHHFWTQDLVGVDSVKPCKSASSHWWFVRRASVKWHPQIWDILFRIFRPGWAWHKRWWTCNENSNASPENSSTTFWKDVFLHTPVFFFAVFPGTPASWLMIISLINNAVYWAWSQMIFCFRDMNHPQQVSQHQSSWSPLPLVKQLGWSSSSFGTWLFWLNYCSARWLLWATWLVVSHVLFLIL